MKRTAFDDTRGVVYLEFLLCFLPVFLLFLGCVQLAFIHVAKQTVKYAAARGARSAAVVLADDPYFYDGEALGLLVDEDGDGSGDGSSGGSGGGIAGLLNIEGVVALWDSEEGSGRMADIRQAVHTPLTALAPNFYDISKLLEGGHGAESLGGAVDDDHASRLLFGLTFYNDAVTAVRFPKAPRSEEFHEETVPPDGDQLTVRVTHLYHCKVPLVSALICRPARELGLEYLAQAASEDDEADGQDGEEEDDDSEPDADEQLWDDLDHVPSRAGLTAVMASAMRVFVLRQEATVTSQWAPYEFRSLDDDD